VSGQHCKLTLEGGYWFVQDLNSQNGTKVNGSHVVRKRLDPGDTLAIGRHKYKIRYEPRELGASGPPPSEEEDITAVLSKSLLDRAGLQRRAEQTSRRQEAKKKELEAQQAGEETEIVVRKKEVTD
jgi:adenylate cyclase